jgi:hypothetical protein
MVAMSFLLLWWLAGCVVALVVDVITGLPHWVVTDIKS